MQASPTSQGNHLSRESSPYLRQHAANPVDWHPWGPEALEKARREDRPIFLSIGYSACHWCHVMAHESFEDPETARLMNRHFINIKVDREERPDLDEIYMQAVMMLTGSGGWPLSVWLTPDLKPFYGGTYFPPDGRHGRPGFRTVLEGISKAWKEKRGEVARSAGELTDAIRQQAAVTGPSGGEGALSREPFLQAAQSLKRSFDAEWGGFGGAPKFPPSMDLELLLRTGGEEAMRMAETTLDRMARGGMYDQLGGGFHRYSTDERWLIPHFEKMLYDNALLARSYLHAWQATGKPAYARVLRETLDYVLREMTSPEGGFYAAQDADTEGEEGKYFSWTPAEIEAVLGKEEGSRFSRTYGVSESGNFEHGKSALWLPEPAPDRMDAARAALFQVRGKRAKPGLDDKILADWNGLMIHAMAEAGAALGEPRYLDAALKAADFCLTQMKRDGRLLHTAAIPGFLDDYAFLAYGCLSLFQATGQGRWMMAAKDLAEQMKARFWDKGKDGGGFFFTADDHEALIARTKHPGDNALPSGNSVAARVCLQLAQLTGEVSWKEMGEGTLKAFSSHYERQPRGWAEMLAALDLATSEPVEIVVTGTKDTRGPLLAEVRRSFLPDALILPFDPDGPSAQGMARAVPLLEGKTLVAGRPAAYVCRGGTCQRPVTDPGELGKLLKP